MSYSQDNQYATKTILVAERTEYEIENNIILKSPHIRSIKAKTNKNEDLRVILPKWVSKQALEKLISFLKFNQIPDVSDVSANGLQRILWLSDFLGLEDFQKLFIKERVIPTLTSSNCLLFLNESFKKLKSSEASSDSWYVLFHHSMNIVAKNLAWNYQNKRPEFLQINDKIMEEIIERSLKHNRSFMSSNQGDIIEILTHARKKTDIFDLLESQRKIVLSKKFLSGPSQPNITWKLANLHKIIEKETNPFKFGGFSWKLVTKMRKDEGQGNQLVFSLKFESALEIPGANDTHENTYSSISSKNMTGAASIQDGILTIYYVMKVNGTFLQKEIQIKSLNIDKNPLILLHILHSHEINELSGRENEFVVNLNLEYTYAALLTHVANNLESFYENKNAGSLTKDDLCTIIRRLPNVPYSQENGLTFILSWLAQNREEREPADILKNIEWRQISTSLLNKSLKSDGIRNNFAASQFLEKELSRKMGFDGITSSASKYPNTNPNNGSSFFDLSRKIGTEGSLNNSATKSSSSKLIFMSDTKTRLVDSSEGYRDRESLKKATPNKIETSNPVFAPTRGRLYAGHPNGETEHPRHLSLQNDYTSYKPVSLNTSLRSTETGAYVPRLLNSKPAATEASQSPDRFRYPRTSTSPKGYRNEETSVERNPDFRSNKLYTNPTNPNPNPNPYSSVTSLANLSYNDPRPSHIYLQSPSAANLTLQSPSAANLTLQSPSNHHLQFQSPTANTANILSKTDNILSHITPSESKRNSTGISLTVTKGLYSTHGLPNNGFISPVTSPTYKPMMPLSGGNASSMQFQSVKDIVSPALSDTGSGSLKNVSMSSSFNNLHRTGALLEKRTTTEEDNSMLLRGRDSSAHKREFFGGRTSYSDAGGFSKKFNVAENFESKNLEEVRRMYATLDKSAQEKITLIRRTLQKDKEIMKNSVFNQINVKNFAVAGKQSFFD